MKIKVPGVVFLSGIDWFQFFLSPAVKEPSYEADQSRLSVTKLKNTWSYTTTHSYALIVW